MSMVPVLRPFAVIVLVFLLIACGEGLFSSLDDPKDLTIETVQHGATLAADASIPIALAYRSETTEPVSAVSVVIRDAQGELVLEEEFTAPALTSDRDPAVLLTGLDAGVYFMEIQAWRSGLVLLTEERQIFVSTVAPVIRSLAVFPSRLAPHSEAVAVAEIDAAPEHRSYMRWSMGARLVAQGYHEEGFNHAVFAAGGEPGVYRIQLEVFPWGPDEGVRPELRSATRQTGDLVVRDVMSVEPDPVVDPEQILLYDFAGHLKPQFVRIHEDADPLREGKAEYSALRSESVVLDVAESRLGYRVSSDGEIAIPLSLYPAREKRAVQLELQYTRLSPEHGTVLVVESPEGMPALPEIRVGRTVEPEGYSLSLGRDVVVYEVMESTGLENLRVELTRLPGEVLVSLVLQGEPVLSLRKGDLPADAPPENPGELSPLLLSGRIVLGANSAVPMLVSDISVRRIDPAAVEIPLEQVAIPQ